MRWADSTFLVCAVPVLIIAVEPSAGVGAAVIVDENLHSRVRNPELTRHSLGSADVTSHRYAAAELFYGGVCLICIETMYKYCGALARSVLRNCLAGASIAASH